MVLYYFHPNQVLFGFFPIIKFGPIRSQSVVNQLLVVKSQPCKSGPLLDFSIPSLGTRKFGANVLSNPNCYWSNRNFIFLEV